MTAPARWCEPAARSLDFAPRPKRRGASLGMTIQLGDALRLYPAMPLPGFIAPQLATAREGVPRGNGWVHEIKFDGYRMLAYIENGEARLLSRNTLDWSRRFGQVTEALADLHA